MGKIGVTKMSDPPAWSFVRDGVMPVRLLLDACVWGGAKKYPSFHFFR